MKVRGLLLDVEGVLVADKRYEAVPGAAEFLHRARAAGCPLRLITNNTMDSRTELLDKLRRAGFEVASEEVHTCTAAAVRRLRALGARRCLVVGTEALRQMISTGGCEVVASAEVDAVVIGLDPMVDYAQLQLACEAVLSNGAALLALNHNRLYTDANGRLAPSVGAVVAVVEYATQVTAEVIGKPSPDYFQQALDEVGAAPADVLVVSDDPFSDLAGAKRMGMRAAFVLSGKYDDAGVTASIPEAEQPDRVAARIGDLLDSGAVELGGEGEGTEGPRGQGV